MILVTGATGNIGSEVVKQLAATGTKVRTLVRNLEKAKRLKAANVEIVQGDLEKPETLKAAFNGVDHLFLVTSAQPNQTQIQGNAVKAAKAAGVQHIVKLSALGASPDSPAQLARWHAQTEKEIRESGLGWTILQPHFFMQNLFNFAPTIASEGAFYSPLKDVKISLIDVRDIAAVAVKTLTEKGHEGKTYVLTGPEALSYDDIAKKLSAALKKSVKYVGVSPEDAQKAMLGMGMPEWLVSDLLKLYAFFNTGQAAGVSPAVAEITKSKGHTFDQFAREFSSVFTKN